MFHCDMLEKCKIDTSRNDNFLILVAADDFLASLYLPYFFFYTIITYSLPALVVRILLR